MSYVHDIKLVMDALLKILQRLREIDERLARIEEKLDLVAKDVRELKEPSSKS